MNGNKILIQANLRFLFSQSLQPVLPARFAPDSEQPSQPHDKVSSHTYQRNHFCSQWENPVKNQPEPSCEKAGTPRPPARRLPKKAPEPTIPAGFWRYCSDINNNPDTADNSWKMIGYAPVFPIQFLQKAVIFKKGLPCPFFGVKYPDFPRILHWLQ